MSADVDRLRRATLLGVPLFGILLLGCGETNPARPPWADALTRIDLGQSVFSLAFVAAPPEGTFLTLSALTGQDAASACAAYMSEPPADFWYFGVDTSSVRVGSYAVVNRFSPPAASPLATVKLVHVRDEDKVETVSAISGDVTISAAPQNATEWHADGTLRGTITVEFPNEPWREQMCTSGQGPGGTDPIVTSCDCIGPEGRVAQCVPTSPTENCCVGMGAAAGTRSFSATIMAAACPWMCKFTQPELASECQALM